jgi:hypothetical protein
VTPTDSIFIQEGFMRAEILYELTESDITAIQVRHRWSQVMTTRFLKLLGWLHESRRTTGHWNDLLKETITSRVLTPPAGSPTAAGNRSFGDFSAASGGDSNKTKDIKIDYKSLTKLKNDRKFCSFYTEFQTRMRGARLVVTILLLQLAPTQLSPSTSIIATLLCRRCPTVAKLQ